MSLRWSLRQKILTALIALVVFLGISIAFYLKANFSKSLREELQKRAVSIARHIAHESAGDILARDLLALKISGHQLLKTEEDIAYVFFLDIDQQKVLAHTFGKTFPVELLGIHELIPEQEYNIRHLFTDQGPIYDISMPISMGGLGQVRLGISASHTEGIVDKLTGEVLSITMILVVMGALMAIPLSRAIASPIEELTRASNAIALGNLDQKVAASSRDEIGQLTKSFNHMVQSLKYTQGALLRSNQEQAAEVARRKAAEGELVSRLNFLKTLMEEMPLPVYFKGLDGAYHGCNRAFEEFFNCTKADLIGLSTSEFLPADQAKVHHRVDQELQAQPGTRIYESEILRKDGSARQVIFHKGTFSDGQGKFAGLVGVMLDVTSERQAEQLRSEFVSTAAHEFQTPLAAIIGFSELLITQHEFNAGEQAEFLTIINEKAEYLSRLVDEMLDVSRLERGRELPLDMVPCHLADLIRHQINHYRKSHPSHHFEMHLPESCPQVSVDEDRVIQVLENLLSNAVKFSPSGTLIQLRAEMLSESFQIIIEDQGKGMGAEHLDLVFEKFYRADYSDTAPSGTGLGLYITKSIIEAHGGSIGAESTPGEGTRITFTLPANRSASPQAAPHSELPQDSPPALSA